MVIVLCLFLLLILSFSFTVDLKKAIFGSSLFPVNSKMDKCLGLVKEDMEEWKNTDSLNDERDV